MSFILYNKKKGETMQKHRKFIGEKRFYLMVLGVAMPIMIQNGITNFVSLLDNIMVGTGRHRADVRRCDCQPASFYL